MSLRYIFNFCIEKKTKQKKGVITMHFLQLDKVTEKTLEYL